MLKAKLNLPDFQFNIVVQNGKELIFDVIRKKYLVLTEEEWVRQNIIRLLTDVYKYPKQHLGVEKQIKVFDTIKRPDIVVYNSQLVPKMIVECKQPRIQIDKQTLNQAINYYLELNVNFFLLTNGITHFCCKIVERSCEFIDKIPYFSEL